MHTRPTRLLAAAVVAAVALLGAACGDDDAASGDGDTTTTAAGDSTTSAPSTEDLEACAEVYPEGVAEPTGPDAVESRGEPEMSACAPSGELEVIDQIEGTGAEVPEGSAVTVHYSGVAAATGELFDSSWSRGETIAFPLDQVIAGWTQGLVGMKEGGRRVLVIPPELGYGDGGPAPGDSLVFTVDLVSVDAGTQGATSDPAGG